MPVNLLQHAALGMMKVAPRAVTWRFSRRYIAGTSLDAALESTAALNANGARATMDVLGEDSTRPAEVHAAVALYLDALAGIRDRRLDCGISVKLSEMGLRFDESGCIDAMRTLLTQAADCGVFVRIDMEDSSVTSVTLDLYRQLRREFTNVGTVIQSCLHRSAADVAALLDDGITDLRLCKGIYVEPPSIAYVEADDIRDSFKALLVQLLDNPDARVGIATHDPALVNHALEEIRRRPVSKQRYEFQMLLGVAEPLRRQLIDEGHPVRVYVPFGERWYDYSMRRLRENPHIARHIISNLIKRR